MAIQTDLLNILMNNSHKKQLSGEDYVFELSLEQYSQITNELYLYYERISKERSTDIQK